MPGGAKMDLQAAPFGWVLFDVDEWGGAASHSGDNPAGGRLAQAQPSHNIRLAKRLAFGLSGSSLQKHGRLRKGVLRHCVMQVPENRARESDIDAMWRFDSHSEIISEILTTAIWRQNYL